jgi:adenylate kinase family enzyme
VPWLELDSVFHQPGWTELPEAAFRRGVGEFVAGDAWVVDGNYVRVRDLVLARADPVVWLRVPRPVVLRQVLWRTARRVVLRRDLWNGNRESLRNVLSLDPQRSIVAWAWRMHGKYDAEYAALQDDRWVVLRSRREVRAFLAGCSA